MQRFTLLIFILLILMFNVTIGITEANVDNLGHLGGLIVGIIMGFAIAENDERTDRNQSFGEFMTRTNWKNKIGIMLLITYFAVLMVIFYTVVKVKA